MTGVDPTQYQALTFDCYGTLIDWETGILRALRRLLGEGEGRSNDRARLEEFGRLEAEAEGGAFRRYSDVLASVARGLGRTYDVDVSSEEAAAFADSVREWPVFEDTVASLRALSTRYRLAIVSNIDDELFAGSAEKLQADFAEVVTAEQVESYKPARAHFDEVLRRLDLPTERVLHVAQSLYHDVAPAKELGFTCVWVNRRKGRLGGGATPPAEATPDLEIPDLRGLVDALGVGG